MLLRLPRRILSKSTSLNFISGFSTSSDPPNENQQQAIAEKVADFFKRAEELVAKEQQQQKQLEEQVLDAKDPEMPPFEVTRSSKRQTVEADEKRPHSTAVAFVPWTLGRLLQEMNIRKLPAKRVPNEEQSFATLLRNSPFIQLGDFDSREVIGVVIENVNDTDLYIDFGGKFHCVCPQPANQHYPRGSLVRIRLRDPEMTNKFMINTKGISLCEADATLLGPYRGRVVRTASGEEMTVPVVPGDSRGVCRPATENDSVWFEHWRLF